MNLTGKAKKLTIIIGEHEKVYQRPLYEAIVFAAKKYRLSGATVVRGILSFGNDSLNSSAKVFELSGDFPVTITLIDVSERIEDFSAIMSKLLDKAGSGGIIYHENVDVVRYANQA